MKKTDMLIKKIFEKYEKFHGVKCPWKVVDFKSDSDLQYILDCLNLSLNEAL